MVLMAICSVSITPGHTGSCSRTMVCSSSELSRVRRSRTVENTGAEPGTLEDQWPAGGDIFKWPVGCHQGPFLGHSTSDSASSSKFHHLPLLALLVALVSHSSKFHYWPLLVALVLWNRVTQWSSILTSYSMIFEWGSGRGGLDFRSNYIQLLTQISPWTWRWKICKSFRRTQGWAAISLVKQNYFWENMFYFSNITKQLNSSVAKWRLLIWRVLYYF